MPQYMFGTGQLFANTVGGGNPLRVGALQDVSVEFSGDTKQLFGQYQFALDVARGKTKLDGKFGSGNIDVAAFNTLFFNQAGGVTTGEKLQALNEAGAVPGSTTYTITPANAGTFYRDLGVTLVSTGLPLKYNSTGTPAAGEYSVNTTTGVYTFNSAQASAAVLLNYLYTSSSTGGTVSIDNQLMGAAPTFELILSQSYKSKVMTMVLYTVIIDKLSLPLKQEDYLIAEAQWQAQANSANQVGFITTTSKTGGGA